MRLIRFATRNWRPDSRTLIHTGDYRVPLDMSEQLADRAIAEGVAEEVPVETKPAPATYETKPARRASSLKQS